MTALPSEVSPCCQFGDNFSTPRNLNFTSLLFHGLEDLKEVVATSLSFAADLSLAVGRGQRDRPRSSVKAAQLRRGLQEEQKSHPSLPGRPQEQHSMY